MSCRPGFGIWKCTCFYGLLNLKLDSQAPSCVVYMADEKEHGLAFLCDQFESNGVTVKQDSVDTEVDRVLKNCR